MTVENTQNLTEEEELEAMIGGLNDPSGVDDIAGLSQEGQVEKDKNAKIAHAFATKKQQNKAAAVLLEKQQTELDELRKFKKEKEADVGASGNVSPADLVGKASVGQAGTVIKALTVKAMQNLGIYEITTPDEQEIVRMERDRLYLKQADQIEAEAKAKERAPAVVEEELSSFSQLDEDAKKVVKERLDKYGVLQQTDKSVIRKEVTLYLGEQSLVAGSTQSNSNEEEEESSPTPRTEEQVSSSIAAASAVKSGRTGVGVKPGKRDKQNTPAPATPEETSTMKKLNMTDLKAFREAQKRKEYYKGR